MSLRACMHEHEVWQASASGRWTPALDAHARGCATCSDVRLITEALGPSASPAPVAVSPSALWFCARHIRRVRAMTRIELVSLFGQLAAVAVITGVALSFVDWPTMLVASRELRIPAWGGLAIVAGGAVLLARRIGQRSHRSEP